MIKSISLIRISDTSNTRTSEKFIRVKLLFAAEYQRAFRPYGSGHTRHAYPEPVE